MISNAALSSIVSSFHLTYFPDRVITDMHLISLAGYPLRAGTQGLIRSSYQSNSFPSRIVVYSPQVYENYALQSGEGLSVAFVLIWLAGDLCNLAGALIAGLLPTIIILASYVSPLSSSIDSILIEEITVFYM